MKQRPSPPNSFIFLRPCVYFLPQFSCRQVSCRKFSCQQEISHQCILSGKKTCHLLARNCHLPAISCHFLCILTFKKLLIFWQVFLPKFLGQVASFLPSSFTFKPLYLENYSSNPPTTKNFSVKSTM
jgi:hypothetical protein